METLLIDTLDNPGWYLKFPLVEKSQEDSVIFEIGNSDFEEDWLSIRVFNNILYLSGDPGKLNTILKKFESFSRDKGFQAPFPILSDDSALFLEKWYKTNCDGEWEHFYGVEMKLLNNKWSVTIDLEGTSLEEGRFETISLDGFTCFVERDDFISKFKGYGTNLNQLLTVFKEWAIMVIGMQ